MAKGTTFGKYHSNRDLKLIQQKVEVSPAQPKTRYVDIPGADGSKDMTEALGVGVKFNDRTIRWDFALYPGDSWYARQQTVSGLLSGGSCHIVLDDDPNYYYDGRLIVETYESDRLLRRITVKAICRPYKLHKVETVRKLENIPAEATTVVLQNDRMPVVPTITVEQSTTIAFGDFSATVQAGQHKLLGIRLTEGDNTLTVTPAVANGTCTIRYREGAL